MGSCFTDGLNSLLLNPGDHLNLLSIIKAKPTVTNPLADTASPFWKELGINYRSQLFGLAVILDLVHIHTGIWAGFSLECCSWPRGSLLPFTPYSCSRFPSQRANAPCPGRTRNQCLPIGPYGLETPHLSASPSSTEYDHGVYLCPWARIPYQEIQEEKQNLLMAFCL